MCALENVDGVVVPSEHQKRRREQFEVVRPELSSGVCV
jgi:hypothetical protein